MVITHLALATSLRPRVMSSAILLGIVWASAGPLAAQCPEQQLLSGDGGPGSLAVDGNVAVRGSTLGGPLLTGSAYVFRFNGTSWVHEQRLLASDGTTFDHFGTSVAVERDLIVVGADTE